jgi:hypothetical protein
VLCRALRGPALLAFHRPGRTGDHRRWCDASYDVRGVSAGRRVQGVGVEIGENPPECALAGDGEPAEQRVEAGTDALQDVL